MAYQIGEDRIGGFPRFPLSALEDSSARDRFVEALEWFVYEVQSVANSAATHTDN
jgi:hypothetical protein